MELTIEQALEQGVAAHDAGNLQEAERAYRAILQSQPQHPDAHHNLGLIAIAAKQIEAALQLFESALEINPNIEQFWISYINALIKNNQSKDAEQAIKKAKKRGFDATKLQALLNESKGIVDTSVPSQARLNSLIESYQCGRYEDAEKLAISISQEFPRHYFSWKILGASFKATGRASEALIAFQKAITLSPTDAEAHNALGVAFQELGRLEEALASLTQATALKPNYAEAHGNLGNTLKEMGRLDDAVARYERVIALLPNSAEAYSNLGCTLQELNILEEARTNCTKAIRLKADFAAAHNNLGNSLQGLGRLDEAEASYRQAIALTPDFVQAHDNLGCTLKMLGRLNESEASHKQAIALDPDFAEAYANLGIILFSKGDNEGAFNCFHQSFDLRRRRKAHDGHHQERLASISKSKLDHDIEQFKYLATQSIGEDLFSNLAFEYMKIRDETPWISETGQTEVDPEFRTTLVNSKKLLHQGEAGRVNQAINGALDTNSIYDKYFSHEFGLTYIDDFLGTEALESLRKFLVESTIWYEQKAGGYLGAYLNDGLASPLLLQIASELKSRFPLILKDHSLNQVWAYKYDSRASDPVSEVTGIRIHADFAAININFWVTHSKANLDSDSGGMVVYNTEAPKDWSFDSYNNNLSRIQEELSKSNGGREVIPYRENRMVIFNSNLFHETDKYHFKEGYENRRINVTMLFGRREDN